jgi:hypothetical protein
MHRHFHRLHGAFANMLAICLALCLPFSGAQAESQTEVVGGNGGTAFSHTCPAGQFLVGIYGWTGQIVDGIGLTCASWNALHTATSGPTTGSPQRGPYFGGRGGNYGNFQCPAGSAISGWLIEGSYGDSPYVVGNIDKQECRSLAPPHGVLAAKNVFFGGDQRSFTAYPFTRSPFNSVPVPVRCPPGELANGLYGGSGVYLDRVGLLCAVPQAPQLIKPPPFPAAATHPPVAPPPAHHLFGTAKDDVDVYNHQPDSETNARTIAIMRQGQTRQVIQQIGGWSLLFGAGGGGADGWVASDHLAFKTQ